MPSDPDNIRQIKAQRAVAIDTRDGLINELLQLQDQVNAVLVRMESLSKMIAMYNQHLAIVHDS